MNAPRAHRKIHRVLAIIAAVPLLLVVCSGIVLQLKKHWEWVQPPTFAGESQTPTVSFEAILDAVRGVPEAGISGWEDVERLDLRVDKGAVKVRGHNRWEVQVDTATAKVLHVAYRRSDLIESLHDGTFFGEAAKLGVFLPAAFMLLVLWVTGMYLWWLPHGVRRRRAKTQGS